MSHLSSEHGLQLCVVFIHYKSQPVLATEWHYVCVCVCVGVSVDWRREDIHYRR